MRDQNAYTRARVLQTWMHLAEVKALDLGHWVCVTQLTVGKLLSPAFQCLRDHMHAKLQLYTAPLSVVASSYRA